MKIGARQTESSSDIRRQINRHLLEHQSAAEGRDFSDQFTLIVDGDDYLIGAERYPCGQFATAALNISEEDFDRLAVGSAGIVGLLNSLAHDRFTAESIEALRPFVMTTVEAMLSIQPLQLMDMTAERLIVEQIFQEGNIDLGDTQAALSLHRYLLELAKRADQVVTFIRMAGVLERDYFRELKSRREDGYAQACLEFFGGDPLWTYIYKQQLFFTFNIKPQIEHQFVFDLEMDDNKQAGKIRHQYGFSSLGDLLVFDFFNGLRLGRGPARCATCGTYFLAMNAKAYVYCSGMAPQQPELTCSQYGRQAGAKIVRKKHPIYGPAERRLNTLRKQKERGGIDETFFKLARAQVEKCREKALFDNGYAQNGYENDLKQANIYRAVRQQLDVINRKEQ